MGGTRIDDHEERKEISKSSLKWTKIGVTSAITISIISLVVAILVIQ